MRTTIIPCLAVALFLCLLGGLSGCGLLDVGTAFHGLEELEDDGSYARYNPSGSIDGQIFQAKKDVEMYDKILTAQLRQRRELQKKIENTSVMDHLSRARSGVEAVRTFDSTKIISRDQDKLEHLDRRIRETQRNLEYSKKKLQDLEKQRESGGDGGGSSC